MSRFSLIKSKDDEQNERLFVLLDGRPIADASAYHLGGEKPSVYFHEGTATLLNSLAITEFLDAFRSVEVTLKYWEGLRSWAIGCLRFGETYHGETREDVIEFQIQFDTGGWAQPYGINELAVRLRTMIAKADDVFSFWGEEDGDDSFLNGFGARAPVSSSETVADVTKRLIPQLLALLLEAEGELLQENTHAIVAIFNFPEPVRPACEQYLIYFGQFLRDLGIDASTEVSERVSDVLFTVQPRDKTVALETIRTVLDAYLQLPALPEAISEMSQGKDIAILQLKANVSHLQAQIALAAAIVQAKDAALSSQATELAMLKSEGDLRRYLPEPAVPKVEQTESLIPGVVEVEPFRAKGVVINLPNIVRALKRVLSR
jgi:hypothetical protein